MKNKETKKPLFSIITVVKNDELNIEKTIKSILNQNFKNFEYIVIEGSSVDKTYDNILKYKRDIDIIVSEKDNGLYYAMNKGAALASGDFVVFVNSGDILTPSALKIIFDKILLDPKIDFIFGTVIRHYTNDTILKYGFNKKKLYFNFDFATAHSTGFYLKRKTFLKVGLFDTRYKCSADYDLYYKILLKEKLKGLSTKKNEIVGEVSAGGFSSKLNFIEHLFEETKIRYNNKQNMFVILIIFLNALVKYFFKILLK